MSSIRQFRNLASQLFKVTLAAQRNDTQETNKQVDGMLDCIAEMLEDMDKTRRDAAPTLSTVADMSEMAFGRPMFMMDPCMDPYHGGHNGGHDGAHDGAHDGEPRLVIHEKHESPTIKVTKIGGDSNLPSVPSVPSLPSLPSLPSVKQDASGTTLESLFLGVSPYQDDPYYEGPSQDGMDGMDYVDHESIRSDDVGIDVRDSDEEDGEDGFEEPKVPFEYEGKKYSRGLLSQRVFDTNGSDETCVGVWVNETFVPLLKTLASQQKKDE